MLIVILIFKIKTDIKTFYNKKPTKFELSMFREKINLNKYIIG